MVEFAPFIMVVLIVGIVAYSRTQRAKYQAGLDAPRDNGDAERMRGEVRMLKDRIAVLERIVTDGDSNRSIALEREIEALRDSREAREGGKA